VRAIAVACPHCGASLTVPGDAVSVSCQYCGKPAQIQRRSRILQVPRPLPPTPSPDYQVARQRVSPAGFLPLVLVPVVLVAGLVAFAALRARSRGGAIKSDQAAAARAGQPELWWGLDVPLLADLDGDGTRDVVGLVRYVDDGDRASIAAFAGDTGALRWQTERVGTFSDANQAPLALTASHVLLASIDGQVRGFDRRTGAPAWTVAIGEKVETFCAGDAPTTALVAAADDRWWALDAAGGKQPSTPRLRFDRPHEFQFKGLARFLALGPEGAPDLCAQIDNRTWRAPAGVTSIDSWETLPAIDGMTSRRLVRHPGGPIVAVGDRSPGTPVPMVARLDGERPRWAVEVPASDPLTARADDKHVALSDATVFVAYQHGSGPYRVAAFALTDGARRWDVEMPLRPRGIPGLRGLVAADGVVLVSTGDALTALDDATGAVRFRIGHE